MMWSKLQPEGNRACVILIPEALFDIDFSGMSALAISKEPAQVLAGFMMTEGMRKQSAGIAVPTRLLGGIDEGKITMVPNVACRYLQAVVSLSRR
jgi:hypothetical protein